MKQTIDLHQPSSIERTMWILDKTTVSTEAFMAVGFVSPLLQSSYKSIGLIRCNSYILSAIVNRSTCRPAWDFFETMQRYRTIKQAIGTEEQWDIRRRWVWDWEESVVIASMKNVDHEQAHLQWNTEILSKKDLPKLIVYKGASGYEYQYDLRTVDSFTTQLTLILPAKYVWEKIVVDTTGGWHEETLRWSAKQVESIRGSIEAKGFDGRTNERTKEFP